MVCQQIDVKDVNRNIIPGMNIFFSSNALKSSKEIYSKIIY